MSNTPPAPPARAQHRQSRWPGWIWAVPIAAVAIVGWLGIRSLLSGGPHVTVVFPTVADVKANDTKVKFNGMEVGEVSSVTVEKDLRHMRVGIDLHADMAGHLGRGTQFWLSGVKPNLADISEIKSIIAGPSIGIDPKPGDKQDHYQGLAEPPVQTFGAEGTRYMLHAPRLGSVQRRTPIYYRDKEVGRVDRVTMVHGNGFDIAVFVDAPYDKLVHDGTRFWNAGAVRLSTSGTSPGVQFQSLPALFAGAIAFETPQGGDAGAVATADHRFTLYRDEDAAEAAPYADSVRYRVVFRDPSTTLQANAPVKLAGETIGAVETSRLAYDPAQGDLRLEATIALDPGKVRRTSGNWGSGRAEMDAMLRTLVGHGLRAELQSSPPVIGGGEVALAMVAGQSGTLGGGDIPEIPAAPGGGSGGVMASASRVMDKIDAMPLAQIADELHQVTQHVAALTASPHLSDTLRQVDRSTAALEKITRSAQREMPATLANLRRAVDEASQALRNTSAVLARSAAGGPGGPESADLPHTLYEVSRAARSLRELADYLDRNPSALLTGRGG